jgi:hypothetical protein
LGPRHSRKYSKKKAGRTKERRNQQRFKTAQHREEIRQEEQLIRHRSGEGGKEKNV